jgi:signal peptidase I
MKRLALIAALALGLVACGSGSTTTIVLQPRNPVPGGVYLQISGSKDAVEYFALSMQHGAGGGLVLVPSTKGKRDCTHTLSMVTYPVTVASLRDLGGQKITLTVYGDAQVTQSLCEQLPSQFPDGFSVVGGNRRVDPMPSSAMEPTLHCASPQPGCLGTAADMLVTRQTGAAGLARLAIITFTAPQAASSACGAGGTFVKRVIGLPGETVGEDGRGVISVRGGPDNSWLKLNEPYVPARARKADTEHFDKEWKVPSGEYLVLGDNRGESCDSRRWASVPPQNIVGPVVQIIRDGKVLKPAGIPG